jgi:hypothetical protein
MTTHIRQEIFSQQAHATIRDRVVEIVLPEWSGRVTPAEARQQIKLLQEFLTSVDTLIAESEAQTWQLES